MCLLELVGQVDWGFSLLRKFCVYVEWLLEKLNLFNSVP